MRSILARGAGRTIVAFRGLVPEQFRARAAASVFVAAALLNLCAAPARAARPAPSGEINVAGQVSVDGVRAVSGQTIFTGSTVATERRSRSNLGLGNLARVELSAETTLKLDFDATRLGARLDAGGVRVYAPQGLNAAVHTADASVEADAAQPAAFAVRFERGQTVVKVQSGRVSLRAAGFTRTAAAGETLSSANAARQDDGDGDDDDDKKRIGIFVAIAAAIALTVIVIAGRDDREELDFGGCVIVLSGESVPC